MSLTVNRIETWACDVPLERPIDVGRMRLLQRSHLAVRVHTADGLVAECVTQTRGSPLDVVAVEVIAPRIVGCDALDVPKLHARLRQDLIAMELDGAIGRAWSAIEICLHDLRAQTAGWPLWRLLGAKQAISVPVMMVEGYALAGEADEEFAQRLAERVSEGCTWIKIEAGHYSEPAQLLRRLELFRKLASSECRLTLDFAWAWSNAQAQLPLAREVAAYGVEWIEDPLPRTDVAGYKLLRRECGSAVGCGDETSRGADLVALIEADVLDVVRLDATTVGGIDVLRNLTDLAHKRGIRVSYHEHPEIHEHCVFGLGIADHVEMFPADRPFDRVHDLIQHSPFQRVRKGHLAPCTQPGTGIRLREDAIARYARRHLMVEA